MKILIGATGVGKRGRAESWTGFYPGITSINRLRGFRNISFILGRDIFPYNISSTAWSELYYTLLLANLNTPLEEKTKALKLDILLYA